MFMCFLPLISINDIIVINGDQFEAWIALQNLN